MKSNLTPTWISKVFILAVLAITIAVSLQTCKKDSTPIPTVPVKGKTNAEIQTYLTGGNMWADSISVFYENQNCTGDSVIVTDPNEVGANGIFALSAITFTSVDSVTVWNYYGTTVGWSLQGSNPKYLNVNFGQDLINGDSVVVAKIDYIDDQKLVIEQNRTTVGGAVFWKTYKSYREILFSNYVVTSDGTFTIKHRVY